MATGLALGLAKVDGAGADTLAPGFALLVAIGFALGLERVDGAGADAAAAGFALLVATGFVLGFARVDGAGADSAAACVVDAGSVSEYPVQHLLPSFELRTGF